MVTMLAKMHMKTYPYAKSNQKESTISTKNGKFSTNK
jgi:hypothetical protein